jgi:hypothetical protein
MGKIASSGVQQTKHQTLQTKLNIKVTQANSVALLKGGRVISGW